MIAITGGLACGKSTVGELLSADGVELLDTDAVAHSRMLAGTEETDAIAAAFGREMLAPDGSVDRKRLAGRVFSNPSALARLNAIVHPGVRRHVREWMQDIRSRNAVGAVQIPLLFESGIEAMGWDAILVVAATPERVRERLYLRGIATEEEIEKRLASQWPLEEKIKRATHIIWNNESRERLADAVRQAFHNMMNKE